MGPSEDATLASFRSWRFAVALAALVAVYVATAWAGLLLAIPPGNVTAVWPPSGLAVSALLLGGVRLWPAVAVATLVVTALTPAPPAAGLGFAIGNTLEALAAVAILRRSGFDASRMSLRDAGQLAIAACVPSVIGAGIGSATLVAVGGIPTSYFHVTFLTWWAGDGLGVLLVVPFVLVWATCSPEERRQGLGELALVLASTFVVGGVVFEYLPSSLYLTFPPLLWGAARLGLRGAVSVSVLLWLLGALQMGPTWVPLGTLPLTSTLGSSQLYFAVCAMVGLLLGGAINERNRAKRELRSRDEWSRAILDGVFDIVAVLDEQGITHWVTGSVTTVLGLPPEEVIGVPLADILHPDDLARVASQIRRLAAEPRATARIVGRCRHADGGWRTLEASVTNALDNPNVNGLVICSRDVTTAANAATMLERARAAALESARLRSEFLANVSHELRTPLNVVFGVTDMLLDEPLPPRHAEQVRTIRQNASSLLRLIDDILDVAKIDAGRLELRRTTFEVRRVVDEVVAALGPGAGAKRIGLTAAVDPALARPLVGDPDRIRQILLNYASNAIKFTESGSVRISAVPSEQTPEVVRVRFEVQDTGIGVPEERLHRLFQPFSQVDGSMSRRYGGTGLGLAISKQLAELMGGDVGVTSMPALGSIFWCEVCLEKPGRIAFAARAETEPATPPGDDPAAASVVGSR
jgi:PAS domain S-box-containing protein